MKNMLSLTLQSCSGPFQQLLTNLTGETGQEWLEEFKRFLRKEPTWAATHFRETVQFPAVESFDPKLFFDSGRRIHRKGSSGFGGSPLTVLEHCQKVVEASSVIRLPKRMVQRSELVRLKTHETIIHELGGPKLAIETRA